MCHGWTWVWESRVLFVFCFESNCNLQRVEVLVKSLGLFGLRYIVFVYLLIPVVSWVSGPLWLYQISSSLSCIPVRLRSKPPGWHVSLPGLRVYQLVKQIFTVRCIATLKDGNLSLETYCPVAVLGFCYGQVVWSPQLAPRGAKVCMWVDCEGSSVPCTSRGGCRSQNSGFITTLLNIILYICMSRLWNILLFRLALSTQFLTKWQCNLV